MTQLEILKQIGLSDEEIPNFVESKFWLEFFPPKDQQDLKEFSVFVDWCGSFITTKVNPFYDSIIRWQFNTLKAAEKVKCGKRYSIFSPLEGQHVLTTTESRQRVLGFRSKL